MESKFFTYKLVSIILSFTLVFFSSTYSNPTNHFLHCISNKIPLNCSITPNDTSYTPVLELTLQNLRFNTSESPKPTAIITPLNYSHVQSTIKCSVKYGLQIRIRSGGHDYDGVSYASRDHTPFILLDLNNLRSVTVDLKDKTAWVESGATLGELSYSVYKKSNLLGFPCGECTSVGVGGQLSGGGYGVLARKYGLAADNVIDAKIVNVNGEILDRASMGEDLFWAIRGGGGASFGVVLSWKINLFHVPPTVTVFSLSKIVDQTAIKVVHKWQNIGPNCLSEDFYISVAISPVSVQEKRKMNVTFNGLFLGTSVDLMTEVNDKFPELGLHETDCVEMSWIESVLHYSPYLRGKNVEALNERIPWPKRYSKVKSDYVQKPIQENDLKKMFKWCLQENLTVWLDPHGGKMSNISESETPYPHRKGNLYYIMYGMFWYEQGSELAEKKIASIRRVHNKMTPYVSMNPREAYVNFRDLDIGTNGNDYGISYLQDTPPPWAISYFKGNFWRLQKVKGEVDPHNFFYHEQSILPPPVSMSSSY